MTSTPRTDDAKEAFETSPGVRRAYVPAALATELELENAKLRRALERIAGTTMSHVISTDHGFTRCRQLAADALKVVE